MIAEYLEALARLLSFDRSLSRRVRREVADHLCEAVAADPTRDRAAAERRAVAAFGRPEMLAAQFAVTALARRTRRLGVAVLLAIAGVLAMMKARLAWYAVVPWTMSDGARAFGEAVLAVDRCAFWLAAVAAAGAVASITRRRIPADVHPRYRRALRRALWLSAAATGLLVVSVISDGVLTALRLGMELRDGAAVPIASILAEIAWAGAAIVFTLGTARRAVMTNALLSI